PPSFAVANAVSAPLPVFMAPRFAEVRVFVFSPIGFVVMSWLFGNALSLGLFVLFRVFQGFIVGPIIPHSQSLLMASYP
ncbi:hypothetical protein PL75_11460, partial [Neisseria arctica]